MEAVESIRARVAHGYTRANEQFLTWLVLAAIGMATGEFLLTTAGLALLHTGYAAASALDYEPSPLYPALLFTLAVFLQDNAAALFLIAALYIGEIAFNLLYKITLKPFYRSFPVGFELVLFNTVLVGHSYGSMAGAIAGVLFGTTYYGIIFGFDSIYQFINIPAYAAVGILAGATTASFATTGIMLAIGYAVTTSLLITLLQGGKLHKTLIFIVTNIAFNYWLFTHVTFI